MAEEGRPDPLNETARPLGRSAGQMVAVVALIAVGVLAGARIWSPVKTVEQRVTAPIRQVVNRVSPLEDLPDLVDATCAGVVSIHLPGAAQDGEAPAPQGILLSGDGFLVTTTPIPDGATPEIWLNDGQRLASHFVRRDALTGITLLQAEGKDLPTLALADPDLPRPGARGFTLRSPAGRGCVVHTALVSSDFVTEDAVADYYVRVSDAGAPPIAGMPFVGADGRVAAMAQPADGDGPGSDRFLPADVITTIASYLMRNADPAPNPYGIIAEDLSPVLADRLGADRGRGAVIIVVGPGSAADKAGLRVGDVILSAGPSPVSSASELNRVLGRDGPTDVTVSRDGEDKPLTLTLSPAPPDAPKTGPTK